VTAFKTDGDERDMTRPSENAWPPLRSHGAGTLAVAAPLSHGSNPNSNMAGRRREDDENLVTHALTSEGADASEDGTGRGTPLVTAFSWQQGDDSKRSHPLERPTSGRILDADGPTDAPEMASCRPLALNPAGVRRLTPTECERLQALPDDWTAHGPDSRRYAALGDAVTSSVAEWIGRRLLKATGTA
jgi:DNA (cytosine-5)-methyltransferase 1